jgi:hypothetical protein
MTLCERSFYAEQRYGRKAEERRVRDFDIAFEKEPPCGNVDIFDTIVRQLPKVSYISVQH